MPTGNPPAYDQAVGNHNGPSVNVTSPFGDTRSGSNAQGGGDLHRSKTNETVSSVESDALGPGLVDEEGRKSMDDEQRDLPDGWVRCFDPNTEHAFYVEESTKRAIWIHPYDDPQFLNSLPRDHPAHPESKQAQAIRKQSQDEESMAKRYQDEKRGSSGAQRVQPTQGNNNNNGHVVSSSSSDDRNWFQRKKDNLVGTKEERAQAKELKQKQKEQQRKRIEAAEQEYIKRRRELIQRQVMNPQTSRYYASDPYRYAPPSMAFSRAGGLYGSPYGYGYGGGYGRRGYGGLGYGGGMGMGLPLMGGLGGGLLLGSAMGGGFGGGYGGFDGGGMGGGDCGGGGGGF